MLWGEEDITDRITSVSNDRITGIVPESDTTGRRQVSLVIDLITYWNATVHFTYMNLPVIDRCWPNSG